MPYVPIASEFYVFCRDICSRISPCHDILYSHNRAIYIPPRDVPVEGVRHSQGGQFLT